MTDYVTGLRHETQVIETYTIRNVNGDRDGQVRRLIEMVLRWRPPCSEPTDVKGKSVAPVAIRALRDLREGQPVSLDRLVEVTDFLLEARAYYREAELVPFYPERNEEAIRDMTELLQEIDRVAPELRIGAVL